MSLAKSVRSLFSSKKPEKPEIDFPAGLICLYDPRSSDQVHHVDIIFVHGLTGNRMNTWTNEKDEAPWPGIVLPKHLPGARILTYGYDAYPAVLKGFTSKTNLRGHAEHFVNAVTAYRQLDSTLRKPIILIAHSLGGLLCKDAILVSYLSPLPNRSLAELTTGVIFMGTPHKGSWYALWAKLGVKTLGVVKNNNASLVDVLRTDKDVLTDLHSNFLLARTKIENEEGRKIHLVAFYETLRMNGLMIVEPSSARLDEGNDIAVRKNHSDLTKFRGDIEIHDDTAFDCLISHIRHSIQPTLRPKQENPVQAQCLESLAFPQIDERKYKISRPDPMTCEWIFKDPNYKIWSQAIVGSKSKPRILQIKGPPGCGKSTLMKALLDKKSSKNGPSDSLNPVCLEFFFHSAGSQLQRSFAGACRALLSQLLLLSGPVTYHIIDVYQRKSKLGGESGSVWNTSELWDLLYAILTSMELEGQTIKIFVDALDECEDESMENICFKLQHLVDGAAEAGVRIFLCISHRQYPELLLRSGLEIRVATHNNTDIQNFVRKRLDFLEPDGIAQLQREVVKRASGNFLWTSLAVSRLWTAYHEGWSSPEKLISVLHVLPAELKGLYFNIVEGMSSDQQKISCMMAQWWYASQTPLTAEEFHFAIALSLTTLSSSLSTIVEQSQMNQYTHQSFGRYVLQNSCGMLQLVSFKDGYTVELIHGSVRDFFLSEEGLSLYGFPSLEAFKSSSLDLVASSIRRYSKLVAGEGVFGTDSQSIASLIAYSCNSSDLRNNSIWPSQIPLAQYLVRHLFYHIQNSSWFISENKDLNNSEFTTRMKVILFGWIYTMCLVTDMFEQQGLYNHGFWRTCQQGLAFIVKHASSFGLSSTEADEVIACTNNRIVFLRDLALDRSEGCGIIPNLHCTYFQFFWTVSANVQANTILEEIRKEMKNLGDYKTVLDICEGVAYGPAFVCKFSCGRSIPSSDFTNINSEISMGMRSRGLTERPPDDIPMISSWSIATDRQQLHTWGLPPLENPQESGFIPLHKKPAAGYISLLLSQVVEESHRADSVKLLDIRFCDEHKAWVDESQLSPSASLLSRPLSFNSLRSDAGIPVDYRVRLNTSPDTNIYVETQFAKDVEDFNLSLAERRMSASSLDYVASHDEDPLSNPAENIVWQSEQYNTKKRSATDDNFDVQSFASWHSNMKNVISYGPESEFSRALREFSAGSDVDLPDSASRRESVKSWRMSTSEAQLGNRVINEPSSTGPKVPAPSISRPALWGVIGVCALDVKARSKPSRNILNRLRSKGDFDIVIFGDKVILDEEVDKWPKCDFLISYYSDGFPLEKAIAYVKMHNPFCINDVLMQTILWDRRICLRILEHINVPILRRVEVTRDGGQMLLTAEVAQRLKERTGVVFTPYSSTNSQMTAPPKVELIDGGDTLSVNGTLLRKPFVEKPVSGEDHNIYIYFPKSQGGGGRKLFRKIGNKSSEFIEDLEVPRAITEPESSYIYEEFINVDNAEDVKAYTVGPNFCHAETRKSPVVDGLVRRNTHHKEIRYITAVTRDEAAMASRIANAFGQRVCGFDILRVNGKSFVNDVNGWSLAKDNDEYYDQFAVIVKAMLIKEYQQRNGLLASKVSDNNPSGN